MRETARAVLGKHTHAHPDTHTHIETYGLHACTHGNARTDDADDGRGFPFDVEFTRVAAQHWLCAARRQFVSQISLYSATYI